MANLLRITHCNWIAGNETRVRPATLVAVALGLLFTWPKSKHRPCTLNLGVLTLIVQSPARGPAVPDEPLKCDSAKAVDN
jgi:hypothetical protein